MSKRNEHVSQWECEHYDIDSIVLNHECEIFDLVYFLMRDIDRLCQLVLDTRSQVNAFAVGHDDPPYPMTAENLYDASYDDHPAMLRYLKLFRLYEC